MRLFHDRTGELDVEKSLDAAWDDGVDRGYKHGAAERERLREVNAKLREALWDLVGNQSAPPLHRWADAVKRGKAAAAEEPHD